MQLLIQSPGIVLSNELQDMVQQKFCRLEKFHHRITRIVVILQKEKHDHSSQAAGRVF